MTSVAQLTANRANSLLSTGPVTETGKQTSSRNATTLGLYTRRDHVKPGEEDLYREFSETLQTELAPKTTLEQSLTAEITSSLWRLRLCADAESHLALFAEFTDDETDKTRRSIERARAAAQSSLHRSINQLRRLQTERHTSFELMGGRTARDRGLADLAQVFKAMAKSAPQTPAQPEPDPRQAELDAQIESIMDADYPMPNLNFEPASRPTVADLDPELASFCKPAPATPRNAPCPCKSGQKFKRCCGRNTLNAAA
jgi:hypothetical protein